MIIKIGGNVIKILVAGSRDFADVELVEMELDALQKKLPTFYMITGGARGVDMFAKKWCDKNEIECVVVRPRDETKKVDYLYRNVEMIGMADYVVVF